MFKKICETCKNEFEVVLCRLKKAKFCSRSCYFVSPEIRKKRSGIMKAMWQDSRYSENMSKAHIGYIPTNLEWLKTYSKSEEGKKRNAAAHRGLKKSFEERQEISKRQSGSKHWNWKTDRTLIKKDDRRRDDPCYKQWRKAVWIRDNFRCRIANSDCEGRIEAHHIIGWAISKNLRYEINNGITLCHAHHPKKRAEEKRLTPIFMELVTASK